MPNDTTPRVHEIAADLRRRIADGEYSPGEQLPSTRALTEHYRISPQAIARVVSVLKADGTVEGKQGKGVFVRTWAPMAYRPQSEFRKKAPEVDIFKTLLDSEHREGEQTIEVMIVAPEERIRQRLQLAPGEDVVCRRRTSYVDGRPFSTDDSYVAKRIVEGSEWMTPGSVERGTNQVLADLGHELVQALDEIYVRMPRPAEVDRLGLSQGTPLAELVTTGHDAGGRPVQVTTCILPGDRHVVVYERTRGGAE